MACVDICLSVTQKILTQKKVSVNTINYLLYILK